jgi:hypothetical protein
MEALLTNNEYFLKKLFHKTKQQTSRDYIWLLPSSNLCDSAPFHRNRNDVLQRGACVRQLQKLSNIARHQLGIQLIKNKKGTLKRSPASSLCEG